MGNASPFPAQEGTHETVTFTVTLSAQAEADLLVDYETVDGTAEAGTDYTGVADTLTIPVGQTSGTVTVTILDDEVYRGTREFTLAISNARLATTEPVNIAGASGLARILDDDVNDGDLVAAGVHPRLLLTSSTIPVVKAGLSASPYLSQVQAYINYLNSTIEVAPDFHRAHAYAFFYCLGAIDNVNYGAASLTQYGEIARQYLLSAAAANALKVDYTTVKQAQIYDWVHNLLDTTDKTAIVNWLKTVPKTTASADATVNNGGVEPIYGYHIVGLAIANDGIDDARGAEINNDWATEGGRVFAVHDMMGGGYGMGMTYSWHAPLGPSWGLANLAECRRTALGLSYEETWTTHLLRRAAWIHAHTINYIRPGSSIKLLVRGLRSDVDDSYGVNGVQATMGILRACGDPAVASFCQWELDNDIGIAWPTTGSSADQRLVTSHFYAGTMANATAVPPTAMTEYFPGHGLIHCRTGWDIGDTDVLMLATDWIRGTYTEYWNNHIAVYRNGPVLIPSGQTTHHSYGNATFAHNTMGFPSIQRSNSGVPSVRTISQFTKGLIHDYGGLKRFLWFAPEDGVDFDYVLMDAKRAYQTPTAPEAVKNFTRQVVYFHRTDDNATDRLIIFDRTETDNAAREKRTYWHPGGENLTIDGVETPGPSIGPAGTQGKWTYEGATKLTGVCTDGTSDNKFYMHWLLPTTRTVVKLGGKSRNNEYLQARTIGGDRVDTHGQINVTSLTRSGTLATLTLAAAHSVPTGQTRWIRITGATPGGYNGFWEAESTGTTTFTFTLDSDPGASAAGALFQWDWSWEYVDTDGIQQCKDVKVKNALFQQFIGCFRVEVTQKDVSAVTNFLTTLEVAGSATHETHSPTTVIEGNQFVGARIADCLAIFADSETQAPPGGLAWSGRGHGYITVPSEGTYRLVVADLLPNTNYVIGGEFVTSSASGVARITVTTTVPDQQIDIEAS